MQKYKEMTSKVAFGGLRASMEESDGPDDDDEEAEREGKEAPGGGSVRSNLSSFCIRRLSLAACAIFFNFGKQNWILLLVFRMEMADLLHWEGFWREAMKIEKL